MKYRWIAFRVVVLVAACIATAVGCEQPAQPAIGPTPVAKPAITRLIIDIPTLAHLGDGPITPVALAQLADGATGELPESVCVPQWSSSSPDVARINDRTVEIVSVGDVTIRADCGGELRGEAGLGVRTKVPGTVVERNGNIPTANAQVRVVGTSADGTSALTDNSGRFVLSVADAELEVEASAPELQMQRQRIKVGAGDVLFRLDPALLTTEWSGTFRRRPGPQIGMEAIGMPPDGLFEFETHHSGPVTISIMAGCNTMGTYDDFGAVVLKTPTDHEPLVGTWAYERFQWYTKSIVVVPGKYLLSARRFTFYGTEGCPWGLVFKRPH